MSEFGIALAIISMITLAMTSGLFNSSPSQPTQPTGNPYYRGGKTIRQQSNKNDRKKTLRYKK
jgi:hypothetical protein